MTLEHAAISESPVSINGYPEKLYSPQAVCEILDIGLTSFYKLVKENRLRAVKLGGLTKVPSSSLRTLISELPNVTEV